VGKVILLTGRPGSGKTTAIRKIVSQLTREVGGFYTEEIREKGRRVGFRILTMDAREGVMAHVDIQSPDRIGKYGVDLTVIDTLAVESLQRAISEKSLIIIDEIGPMELLSSKFKGEVLDVINGDSDVLGTIAKRKSEFINQIRRLPNVTILEIFPGNREQIVEDVVSRLEN
jgi:nucleoside-triphosphatase